MCKILTLTISATKVAYVMYVWLARRLRFSKIHGKVGSCIPSDDYKGGLIEALLGPLIIGNETRPKPTSQTSDIEVPQLSRQRESNGGLGLANPVKRITDRKNPESFSSVTNQLKWFGGVKHSMALRPD